MQPQPFRETWNLAKVQNLRQVFSSLILPRQAQWYELAESFSARVPLSSALSALAPRPVAV
jgi:hypothetical protein